MKKILLTALAVLGVAGCESGPRPAKSRLTGGEAEISSHTIETLPKEKHFTLEVETAPPPEIHITVIPPDDKSEQPE